MLPLNGCERANAKDVQQLMILAFRILRSSGDAWAVLSSVSERYRSALQSPGSTPRLQDVVLESIALINRRTVTGPRFGHRQVRRYQREIMQHLPDTDAKAEAALSVLPDRARTVLILHDLEMLPLKEIADLLDITPGGARWYLHRARTLVRLQLYIAPAT